MQKHSNWPVLATVPGLALAAALVSAQAFSADPGNGKQVYNQTCIACHGPDGTGAMGTVPDLTGPDGRLTKPEDVLLKHIREGFQSPGSPMAMPAKGGNPSLTEKDLEDVLAYMLEQFQ